MTVEKVRENKVRRIAERRGFKILKSRRRDPLAIGYGGYMVQDLQTGGIVFGAHPREYAATLEEIEEYFGEPANPRQVPARKAAARQRRRRRSKTRH